MLVFNPKDIVSMIRKLLDVEDIDDVNLNTLNPYYKGFKGSITSVTNSKWICRGTFKRESDKIIRITELPIDTATEKYKDFLKQLEKDDLIDKFESNTVEDYIDFKIWGDVC